MVPLVAHEKLAGVLSIRVTLAILLHVFPARSWKVNVNDQFPVKRCQVVFIPVRGTFPESVAITS